jgi:hypothetical protein
VRDHVNFPTVLCDAAAAPAGGAGLPRSLAHTAGVHITFTAAA